MIKALFLLAFVGVVCGYSVDPTRIVGGVETTIAKRPYQAALLTSSNFLRCGGSIITKKHILSAAHCYYSGELYVRVGSANHEEGGQRIKVLKQTQHPKFNSRYLDNDFMVVELESEIKLSSTVAIIKLAQNNTEDPEVASPVTVSGWGVVRETDADVPKILREADLPLVDRAVCKKTYSFISTNQICLGGTDQGMLSACFGDSGGPAVYNGVQYGLVSGGNSCEKPKVPGIFARISAGRDWIDSIVAA